MARIPGREVGPNRPERAHSMLGTARRTRPTRSQDARRRWLVTLAKRVLPVAALGLLALLTLWPELTTDADRARIAYRRGTITPEGGTLRDASYTGVDENGEPYRLTAAAARQIMGGGVAPDRTVLTAPTGDITLASGAWLMVQAAVGVYMQKDNQLDLSGEVSLYSDDGIEMHTNSVTLDLKAGVALGAEQVHVQGPFGQLDAQGFSVTERGATLHFVGPAHLVLDGAGK